MLILCYLGWGYMLEVCCENGDISEVNLHDEEEYMSEVPSHMLKRVSFRRQKR